MLINTIHIIAHTLTFNKRNNKQDCKFEILDQKVALQILSKVFVMKKVKNTLPWTHVISDLNSEIVGTFYEKELNKNKSKRF